MVALRRTDVLVTLLCSLRFHPHSLPPWKGGPLAVDEVMPTGRARLRLTKGKAVNRQTGERQLCANEEKQAIPHCALYG